METKPKTARFPFRNKASPFFPKEALAADIWSSRTCPGQTEKAKNEKKDAQKDTTLTDSKNFPIPAEIRTPLGTSALAQPVPLLIYTYDRPERSQQPDNDTM